MIAPLRLPLLTLLICVLPCISRVAQADLILGFAESDIASASFSSSPGSTLTLQLLLTQSNGETRLTSPGLAIADFVVSIDGVEVLPTDFTFGTGFVDDGSGNSAITGASARIAEFESSGTGNNGVTANVDSNGDTVLDSVSLGTITYNIGALASGTYNLTIQKRTEFGAFSLADPAFPVDITNDVTNGSAVLTISAVPEPSSLGCLIIGAFVGCFVRSRRCKASATGTPLASAG